MLISTSEVAARYGLSKPTIWRYRQRYDSFPKPIIIEGSSALRWMREEVDVWFLSRKYKGGK